MKKEIKARIESMKNTSINRYRNFNEKNFIPSSGLVYWIAAVLISLDVAHDYGGIILPIWLGKVIIFLGCMLAGFFIRMIAAWFMVLMVRLFTDKNKIDELIAIIGMAIVIAGCVSYFSFKIEGSIVTMMSVIVGIILLFYFKCLWSLIVGKRVTRFNIEVIILGTVFVLIGAAFLNSEGYEDTYINTYLKLDKVRNNLSEIEKQNFKRAISGGRYSVEWVEYNTQGAPLVSKTVNLKGYAQNKGIVGYIKKKYQGYDLDEVPLRGKIWYPKEGGHYPTLFIAHGNHDYKEQSYLGYEYLGRYLARFGYVVVSIDQNACNLLKNENDARAILLLENIKQIKQYNEEKDNPLFGKINMLELAIAGHSRGGEAVSVAYLLNGEGVNPNNGKTKLNYDFNIRSVIAIAPTVDQYKPTSKSVQLEDVNYMVLHGANDQDVYQFSGLKQYKNIGFTGKGDYIKTALYCAGCNHGQFNSRWGTYDQSGLFRKVLNVKNFLSEREQQQIAEIFIKIFLDCTLKNDQTNQRLLEDCNAYLEYLPKTLYIQSYQKSDFITLCNFEEDISLESGTLEGVTIDVSGGDIWTEGIYPAEVPRSNTAMYLQWSHNRVPTVTLLTPDIDLTKRNLQVDLMDLREDFKEEKVYIQEVKAVLEDAEGNQAEVHLKDYASLYPAFLVRLNKLQYLLGQVEYKHQFQTVSIPSKAFQTSQALSLGHDIDLRHIQKIMFTFYGESGKVAIDEIGY